MMKHIPDHWTPEQALAVIEAFDTLRAVVWSQHGPAIHRRLRRKDEPRATERPPDPAQAGRRAVADLAKILLDEFDPRSVDSGPSPLNGGRRA